MRTTTPEGAPNWSKDDHTPTNDRSVGSEPVTVLANETSGKVGWWGLCWRILGHSWLGGDTCNTDEMVGASRMREEAGTPNSHHGSCCAEMGRCLWSTPHHAGVSLTCSRKPPDDNKQNDRERGRPKSGHVCTVECSRTIAPDGRGLMAWEGTPHRDPVGSHLGKILSPR